MSFNYLYFNDQLNHGRMLRRMLNLSEEGDDLFRDVRAVMIQMCDGNDTSSSANFGEVTARFGFVNNAASKAAFDEIDSAYSKISGDTSVSSVRSARDQIFDKLRG